jgi:hypothetical protein
MPTQNNFLKLNVKFERKIRAKVNNHKECHVRTTGYAFSEELNRKYMNLISACMHICKNM